MARTVTRDLLRARIRFDGNYSNSVKYTDAVLNTEINRAIGEFWRLIAEAQDDRYTTTTTLTIGANTESTALPVDFWRLRKLALLNGASEEVHVLRRIELRDLHRYRQIPESSYYERGYCILGDNIHVRPLKGASTNYKLHYIPTAPSLTSDATPLDGYVGFEDLIIAIVVYRLDMRERKPVEDRLREIERLKDEYRRAIDGRDSAEPPYLEDLAIEDPIY